MKNLKNGNLGITLIALIITIIILLILAGVTLNLLLGENGILKNAEIAAEKYENKAVEEENTLAQAEHYMTNYRAIGNGINYKNDGSEFKTNDTFNGKPVYAKYINIAIGTQQIEHNIKNIDKLWIDLGNSIVVTPNDAPNQYWYAFPNGFNNIYISVNKVYLTINGNTTGWTGFPADILVKYTKTTD